MRYMLLYKPRLVVIVVLSPSHGMGIFILKTCLLLRKSSNLMVYSALLFHAPPISRLSTLFSQCVVLTNTAD